MGSPGAPRNTKRARLIDDDGLREHFREWMRERGFVRKGPLDIMTHGEFNLTKATDELKVGSRRPHVSEFMAGKRPPPQEFLEALGYEPVTFYRRKKR